jgi:hypothetical protein
VERQKQTKRQPIDPPDEPTEPPMSLDLRSIVFCLPRLTTAELYKLKQAVVSEQSARETRAALESHGVRGVV